MKPYTEGMEQRATYWPPAGNDGFGGVAKGEPGPVACRWQNVQQLYRTPEGREAVSQAVVYVACQVKLGGFLLLGMSDARTPPAGAFEIRQVGSSPSLDATEVLHKAIL